MKAQTPHTAPTWFAGALVVLMGVTYASLAAAQDYTPVQPLVTILMDTSGSMEWVPDDNQVYPCCMSLPLMNVGCDNVSSDLSNDARSILNGGGSFDKPRHVIAKEVFTGRRERYWCERRLRVGNGFPFDNGYSLPNSRERYESIDRSSGLLYLNRDLMRFSEVFLDSERDRDDWSFRNPGEGASMDLGIRSFKEDYPGLLGGSVGIGDLDTIGEAQKQLRSVEASINEVIPYGASPLAAAFQDLAHYMDPNRLGGGAGASEFPNDPYTDCRQKHVILVTDGTPSYDFCVTMDDDDIEDQYGEGMEDFCDDYEDRYNTTLFELAELVFKRGVTVHVIGFSVVDNTLSEDSNGCLGSLPSNLPSGFTMPSNLSCLDQMAFIGGAGRDADPTTPGIQGARAYRADTDEALTRELSKVINDIIGPTSSRTATKSTTRTADRRDGVTSLYRFGAAFRLNNQSHLWEGILEREEVSCDPNIVPDVVDFGAALNSQVSNRAVFTAVRDPSSSANLDDTFVELGGRRLLEVTTGFAALLPGVVSTSELNQLFNLNAFSSLNLNTLVGLIRGTDADRSGKVLGDVFNSDPVIVGGPELVLDIPGYERFAAAVNPPDAPRPTMVYVGSNDGQLHAFNGEYDPSDSNSLVEFWSFLPMELQNKIYLQKASHIFGVDSTPVVRDIRMYRGDSPPADLVDPAAAGDIAISELPRPDIWSTVLVSGLRT